MTGQRLLTDQILRKLGEGGISIGSCIRNTHVHRFLVSTGLAVFGIIASLLPLAAQPSRPTANDRLLDLLVFGVDDVFGAGNRIRPSDYAPAVRAELSAYLRRFHAYRSKRTGLAKTGEFGMVYSAWTGYERQLAAHSASPEAPALALAYVSELKPCYEWEGYHDCPEREAVFAAQYLAAHPNSPFSAYLPLLIAHRWICTAEAYEYEKRPTEAARSRKQFERSLVTALKTPSGLVRAAAEILMSRAACYSPPR